MQPTIIGNGKPFISPISHEEYDCAAFQALRPNEVAVYLAMRRRYNGQNNGRIAYSSGQAGKACGMSRSTGGRALSRLRKLGFLHVCAPSANGKANEYELTAFPLQKCRPNEIKTGRCLFMDWRPKPNQRPTGEPSQTSNVVSLDSFRVRHI